jgi:hypothetical protein
MLEGLAWISAQPAYELEMHESTEGHVDGRESHQAMIASTPCSI